MYCSQISLCRNAQQVRTNTHTTTNMIFNRYIAMIFAGSQSLCYASSLRNMKSRGEMEDQSSVERQRDNNTYYRFVSLLYQSYECHEFATGGRPIFFVECENEGGYATLVANGGGSDKIPNKLKVCGYGDDTKETCQSIQFTTGDARNDLEKARRLIQGRGAKEHQSDSTHTEEVQSDGEDVPPPPPFVATDFQQLEEYLRREYQFSCSWSWSPEGLPGSGTELQCTRYRTITHRPKSRWHTFTRSTHGEVVTLFAQGMTNPLPTSLEVCECNSKWIKTLCRSVALSGDAAQDLPAAKAIVDAHWSDWGWEWKKKENGWTTVDDPKPSIVKHQHLLSYIT